MYKNLLCTTVGAVGTLIASWFGGWDASFSALLVFMVADYATGLIVAGVFNRSGKTESGKLESGACFKGLCRKGMILLFVLIGYKLDAVVGASYIRDGVCITFMLSELISITENAAAMGVPIPTVLLNAINLLKSKSEKTTTENKEENNDGNNDSN